MFVVYHSDPKGERSISHLRLATLHSPYPPHHTDLLVQSIVFSPKFRTFGRVVSAPPYLHSAESIYANDFCVHMHGE